MLDLMTKACDEERRMAKSWSIMFEDESEGMKLLKRPKSYRSILESIRSSDFINGAACIDREQSLSPTLRDLWGLSVSELPFRC